MPMVLVAAANSNGVEGVVISDTKRSIGALTINDKPVLNLASWSEEGCFFVLRERERERERSVERHGFLDGKRKYLVREYLNGIRRRCNGYFENVSLIMKSKLRPKGPLFFFYSLFNGGLSC